MSFPNSELIKYCKNSDLSTIKNHYEKNKQKLWPCLPNICLKISIKNNRSDVAIWLLDIGASIDICYKKSIKYNNIKLLYHIIDNYNIFKNDQILELCMMGNFYTAQILCKKIFSISEHNIIDIFCIISRHICGKYMKNHIEYFKLLQWICYLYDGYELTIHNGVLQYYKLYSLTYKNCGDRKCADRTFTKTKLLQKNLLKISQSPERILNWFVDIVKLKNIKQSFNCDVDEGRPLIDIINEINYFDDDIYMFSNNFAFDDKNDMYKFNVNVNDILLYD
jgi:hypothetical protein